MNDKNTYDVRFVNFEKTYNEKMMEKDIVNFFKSQEDLSKVEYFLPNVLDDMFHNGLINIKVVPTKEKWMGITYHDDLETLKI